MGKKQEKKGAAARIGRMLDETAQLVAAIPAALQREAAVERDAEAGIDAATVERQAGAEAARRWFNEGGPKTSNPFKPKKQAVLFLAWQSGWEEGYDQCIDKHNAKVAAENHRPRKTRYTAQRNSVVRDGIRTTTFRREDGSDVRAPAFIQLRAAADGPEPRKITVRF